MLDGCQGKPRTPAIIEKICPQWGELIERFSADTQMACEKCGFIAYNDTLSYIQWYSFARKYVGEEMYKQICPVRTANFDRNSRTAMGHVQKMAYIAVITI